MLVVCMIKEQTTHNKMRNFEEHIYIHVSAYCHFGSRLSSLEIFGSIVGSRFPLLARLCQRCPEVWQDPS